MKRFTTVLLCLLLAIGYAQAQSGMTDNQVMDYVIEQNARGVSRQKIVTDLMQRGVTIEQIRRIQKKYQRQMKNGALGADDITAGSKDVKNRMRQANGEKRYEEKEREKRNVSKYRKKDGRPKTKKNTYDDEDDEFVEMDEAMDFMMPDSLKYFDDEDFKKKEKGRKIFGHDVFNRKDMTFESSMNIATPQNYRLGPGDEVNVDIWGASQESITETISPDGYITIEGVGVVQLGGLTVGQAKNRLRQVIGPRYQDSQIELTLGQTRTITISVTGEVKTPGTYTMSAFATVYNALYMAGGPNDIGTLRSIKVFRDGRQISSVDVYAFLLNGHLTGDVRLQDNDIITVGPYESLVCIAGKVKRPMFYEMKKTESAATLLRYAGGFTGDAYTNPSFRDPRTRTIRNFDFDGDGLQNFQEYLVQALRHLRYDDSETPLMGSWMPDGSMSSRTFIGFLPMNYMDGETFYSQTKDAGFVGGGAWQFRELGYFARPPHEWDPTACIPRAMSNYGDATGYRIMLPPHGLSGGSRLDPLGYASTDPRMWDSDYDNMDDYYELFHGLNPLLGSVANTTPEGMPDLSGDVIARAYAGQICFWSNAWTGWPMMPQDWLSGEVAYRDIDAVKYPWMIGTPEADADGDGLRNGDEALVVNMTSPQPTHTDPTPLWLTDSTAPNKASYTSQYYLLDEEIFLFYPWPWTVSGQTGDGSYTSFLFSFEENEGYDTDRDGVPDGEEQLMTAKPISDPLKFTDPDRRQALWFPGENSAAVSYSADYRRLNYAAYDLLRQFTVEAWICPEDVSRDQVILERVAVYGASTMSNNVAKLRANFRIGIRADGRL